MKLLLVTMFCLGGLTAVASQLPTLTARVSTGLVNPELGPYGAIVDDKGTVHYVNGLIGGARSTEGLNITCWYQFNYKKDKKSLDNQIILLGLPAQLDCPGFNRDRGMPKP